jgi:hypothetical protein
MPANHRHQAGGLLPSVFGKQITALLWPSVRLKLSHVTQCRQEAVSGEVFFIARHVSPLGCQSR